MLLYISVKKLKSQKLFKFLVVFFAITYVAGSFTDMLFIPKYVPVSAQTTATANVHSQPVKYRDFHRPNFLQILDRSTFENDPLNPLCFTPKSFLIIFTFMGFALLALKSINISPQSNISYNLQHSYLSFCLLMI